MLRNLATSLINSRDERIVTTLPKAKELRPFVERAITLSRQAQGLSNEDSKARVLHLRRQAAGFFHAGNVAATSLGGKRGQARPERTAGVAALKRLFGELGELAIIELVDNPREIEAHETEKKRAKATTAKKKASKKAKTESKGDDEVAEPSASE